MFCVGDLSPLKIKSVIIVPQSSEKYSSYETAIHVDCHDDDNFTSSVLKQLCCWQSAVQHAVGTCR